MTANQPSATFLEVCNVEKWKEMPGDSYEEFIALLSFLNASFIRSTSLRSNLLTGQDWDGKGLYCS